MSDDEKIDAWLAGELSDDDAAAVERSMSGGVPTEDADDEFLGLKAEPLTQEVDILIEQVRDSGKLVPPDAEEWRDILMPSDDPDLLGTLGGEPCYEISSVIAVAGMSIVFKGRDPKLNRSVAIKALTPELAANRTTHKRFLREARVAAGLDHENILPIHGVHDDASVPFYAMKFIDGGTLQDALDGEPLPFEKQKSIARQVASALTAAHAAGVVHRDIKPANILLDSDSERVWLCDFGIARSTEDPSLTYAGNVAGTPHYMAPEQATGGEIDQRSDLFSLGAVLYQCATGESPFRGETSTAVIHSVNTFQPEKAQKINPELPSWYGAMLEKLLAKQPGDRISSAADVVALIDDPPPERASLHWLKYVALVGVLGSIAAAAIHFLSEPAEPVPELPSLLVTTVADEDDGSADPKLGGGTSLREAILYGEAGIPISLSPELSGATLVTESVIRVDSKRVIDASDLAERPVIDAGKSGHSHFYLSLDGSLTLKNLTLTGGVSEGNGGSIESAGGELTLEDCHLIDNQALSGGAIIVYSGTANFLRCHFKSNRAVNHATRTGGGALNINNSTATITSCRFESNFAENNGGAVRATTSKVTLDDCTFIDNYAPVGGCVRSREGAIVNIHNCKFEKNRAKGASVAAANDGQLSISESIFTGNVASETTGALYASRKARLAVTGCTFTGNTAVTTAGAIFHNGPTLNLHDCQFRNNTAASGGAVHIAYGQVEVRGNTFLGNAEPQLLIGEEIDRSLMSDNVTTDDEEEFELRHR